MAINLGRSTTSIGSGRDIEEHTKSCGPAGITGSRACNPMYHPSTAAATGSVTTL